MKIEGKKQEMLSKMGIIEPTKHTKASHITASQEKVYILSLGFSSNELRCPLAKISLSNREKKGAESWPRDHMTWRC